jgi:hypothetical protein
MPVNTDSPYSTYSDTAPQKRVISDYIINLDPSDAPFIEAIGGLDGAASKFRFANKGKVVEWLEDTLTPLAGTFYLSATAVSTATALTVSTVSTLGTAFMIQPGHILSTSTELLWVSAVNTTTGAVTVTRAIGGTAVTLATDATFAIVGMARLEGDESDPIGYTDIGSGSNYTQIFHKELKVTGTEMAIDNYGMSDAYQYQAAKSIPEMMRLIERTLQYGVASAGSMITPRMMAGYPAFLSGGNLTTGANFTTVATSVAVPMIEDALELAYNDGGGAEYIAVISPSNYQALKNKYDSSAFVRYAPEQTQFGTLVDKVITPFGNVSFVIDRWQRNDLIPFFNLDNIGMLTLRPWQVEDLAKTGDYKRSELIGEFTFCLRGANSHAMLTAVS